MSKQLQAVKQLQQELDTPKKKAKGHKVSFTCDDNGDVRFLDLSHLGAKTEHLKLVNNLPYLTVLWAKNNLIDKIENIDNLTKLRWLDFTLNRIAKIEGLNELISLEDLALGGNKIKKIENIDHLKKLESIGLFDNEITKIEGIKGLNNLAWVSLWGNDLTNLDEFDKYGTERHPDTVIIFVKPKGRQNPLLDEYQGSI
jgi:hypothetical protein